MVRVIFAMQWPFLASPCARPFCPSKHMLYHTKRSERYLLQKGILYYSYVEYLDADPQFFQLVYRWRTAYYFAVPMTHLFLFFYTCVVCYVPCKKFAYYFAVPMTHRLLFFYTCVVLDIDLLCTVKRTRLLYLLGNLDPPITPR